MLRIAEEYERLAEHAQKGTAKKDQGDG